MYNNAYVNIFNDGFKTLWKLCNQSNESLVDKLLAIMRLGLKKTSNTTNNKPIQETIIQMRQFWIENVHHDLTLVDCINLMDAFSNPSWRKP